MFELTTGRFRDCEGVSRRQFLRVGALSAFGMTLPGLLRAQAASSSGAGAVSCIQIWLPGGPSHIDTFDPKPAAPREIRGEFAAIPTRLAGVRFTELLPRLAANLDKFSVLRTVTSPDGGHETATHYMLTGYPFSQATEYPGIGAVVAREKGYGTAMPPYAWIGGLANRNYGGGGYMGPVYNPFQVVGDPNAATFSVRDVTPPAGMTPARMARRHRVLEAFDRWQRGVDARARELATIDEFYHRAYAMVTSPAAKRAFAIGGEDPRLRDKYGRNQFGQSLLLARRLIEAGIRYVTVSVGSWDSHTQNFVAHRNQVPLLDQAYAALLEDLQGRGLLERTIVTAMGEFGRTPKVNPSAGRDHWPGAMFVTIGGGGIKTGVVVGETNEHAEVPKDRPIRVEDVAATLYHALGIDLHKEYLTGEGRPIMINYGGVPVREVL